MDTKDTKSIETIDTNNVDDLLQNVSAGEIPASQRGPDSNGETKWAPLGRKLAKMYDENGDRLYIILPAGKAGSICQALNEKLGVDNRWKFRTRTTDRSNKEAPRFLFCDDNDYDWPAYFAEKEARRRKRMGGSNS